MPSPVLYAGAGRCRSRRQPWTRKISMPKTKTRLWRVPVEKMEVRVSVRTRCGSELQPEEWAAPAPAVRRSACRRYSCRAFRPQLSRGIPISRSSPHLKRSRSLRCRIIRRAADASRKGAAATFPTCYLSINRPEEIFGQESEPRAKVCK
jgi:hypothetical protein